MKDIKNILFDLGGVLYHIDYNLTKVAFEKLGVNDFNTHYSQQQQNKLFDNLETGKISSKEFISKMLEILPHSSEEDIVDAWNALLIGFTKENCLTIPEHEGNCGLLEEYFAGTFIGEISKFNIYDRVLSLNELRCNI